MSLDEEYAAKLKEAAEMFLARSEYDILKFKRDAAKAIVAVAKDLSGGTSGCARRLRVDRRTIYRIEGS